MQYTKTPAWIIKSNYVSTTADMKETFEFINKEYGPDVKDRFFEYLVNLLNENWCYDKPLEPQNINWKKFDDEFKGFCAEYSPDPAQYFKEVNLKNDLYNNPRSEEDYNVNAIQEISDIFTKKVTLIRKPKEYEKEYSYTIKVMEEHIKKQDETIKVVEALFAELEKDSQKQQVK